MIISILLPSRKNLYNLSVAVDSYILHFSGENELEILVGLDDDDETRFDFLEKYKNDSRIRPILFKRLGYWNNHIIMNILAKKSRGHILWMGNCKSMVLTPRWDKYLERFENKMLVGSHITEWYDHEAAHPVHRYTKRQCMLFPIVSIPYIDVLGKFSNYCRNDSWIGATIGHLRDFGQEGTNYLNKIHPTITEISICHDRSKVPKYDEPTFEKEWCISPENLPEEYRNYGHIFFNQCTAGDGFSAYDSAKNERIEDAKKIFYFLKNNKNYLP